MVNLANKVAIITGSASGLGKALAKELFSQGCNLALIDLDTGKLKALKTEFSNNKQIVTTHSLDISNLIKLI